MMHELSDKEFIAGIIKGDFNGNDVFEWCKHRPNIKEFYASLIQARSRLIEKHTPTIASFDTDAVLEDYSLSDKFTIDAKRQLSRIENALSIVEDMINGPQQEKTISRKEHSIDSYILYQDKEKVKKVLLHFISGNRGTKAAMIVLVAVELGLIKKPPTNMLKEAFELAGSKQGFDTAYRKYCADIDPKEKARRETTIKEIEITKNAINDFLRE